MIACVMTLESRDKHARIIHEPPGPKPKPKLSALLTPISKVPTTTAPTPPREGARKARTGR